MQGIRVIDLTSMWAGPLCTRILADLGAQVIKIEAPMRPDGTRANLGFFTWLNRNKLGVTMNLNLPAAKDYFKRLASIGDVVVENFSARVMSNFGLDYQTLKETRPDLIMLSMPAYGSSGPYKDFVAYGHGLEASSGLAALTGYSDGPPMLSGSAYGDPVAGLHGVLAVLAALRYRRRTGKGQWIDLSQREALSQMFGETFLQAAKGENVPKTGNRHPLKAPYGCYKCLGDDRWVALAVGSDEEWRKLCRAMGKESLAYDPEYATLQARVAHRDELDRKIEAWTMARERTEVVEVLQRVGLAAGVVADARDLATDSHLAARGFFDQMADIERRVGHFPGLPWKTTTSSNFAWREAPQFGEHNGEVLGGLLGLSDAEIAEVQHPFLTERRIR